MLLVINLANKWPVQTRIDVALQTTVKQVSCEYSKAPAQLQQTNQQPALSAHMPPALLHKHKNPY
jgi:hypothetical protein